MYETRTVITEVGMEERAEGSPVLTGLAIPYNSWSEDLGGFRERFAPGSAAKSMAEDDWRAIWGHSDLQVIGRVSSGSLRVSESDRGVSYEADVPIEAQWAKDMMVSIRRKDLRENSFRFRALDEVWEERDGMLFRTVTEAGVREIGPQTFPAYPQTTAEARSIDDVLRSGEEFMEKVRKGLIDPAAILAQLDLVEVQFS